MSYFKCIFFIWIGCSDIVRKLDDDEQVETDSSTEEALTNYPSAISPSRSLYEQYLLCEQQREEFLRNKRRRCFACSRMCHFVFLVLQKSYCLPTEKCWKSKGRKGAGRASVDSVIYLPGSSKIMEDSTAQQTVTLDAKDESTILESTATTDDVIASRESTVQENTIMGSKVMSDSGDSQQTKSSLVQPTSTADDISQTGSTKDFSETVLSTTAIETQSKTPSAYEAEATISDPTTIDPTPASVSKDASTSLSSQEATPSLPQGWKPDTKDLMEDSTVAENQESRKTQTSTSSAKVSVVLYQGSHRI